MPVIFRGTSVEGSPKLDNRIWLKPYKILKDNILSELRQYENISDGINDLNDRFKKNKELFKNIQYIRDTFGDEAIDEEKVTVDLDSDFYFIIDLFFFKDVDNVTHILSGNYAGMSFQDYYGIGSKYKFGSTYMGLGNMVTKTTKDEFEGLKGYGFTDLHLFGTYKSLGFSHIYNMSYNSSGVVNDVANPNLTAHAQSLIICKAKVKFYFTPLEVELLEKVPDNIMPVGNNGNFVMEKVKIGNKIYYISISLAELGFYPSYLFSIATSFIDKYNVYNAPFNISDDLKDAIMIYNIKSVDNEQVRMIESNLYVWSDKLLYVHYKTHIIRIIDKGGKMYFSKVWKVNNITYTRLQNFHTLCHLLEYKYFDNIDSGIITLMAKGHNEVLDYLNSYYNVEFL